MVKLDTWRIDTVRDKSEFGCIQQYSSHEDTRRNVINYVEMERNKSGAKVLFSKDLTCTASLGISVMLLSGTEVAATSAPNKSMTLDPKLGEYQKVQNLLDPLKNNSLDPLLESSD